MMIALLGSTGLALAQSPSPQPPSPMSPQPPSQMAPATQSPTRTVSELTPQQRADIYSTVIKEKRAPLPANTSVSVGGELPGSIELYSMPDAIATATPSTKQLKYAVWNNQVVLVDPTSMKVVEVIRQ